MTTRSIGPLTTNYIHPARRMPLRLPRPRPRSSPRASTTSSSASTATSGPRAPCSPSSPTRPTPRHVATRTSSSPGDVGRSSSGSALASASNSRSGRILRPATITTEAILTRTDGGQVRSAATSIITNTNTIQNDNDSGSPGRAGGGLSPGAAAGIGAGVTVIVVVFIAVFGCIFWRRRKRPIRTETNTLVVTTICCYRGRRRWWWWWHLPRDARGWEWAEGRAVRKSIRPRDGLSV